MDELFWRGLFGHYAMGVLLMGLFIIVADITARRDKRPFKTVYFPWAILFWPVSLVIIAATIVGEMRRR